MLNLSRKRNETIDLVLNGELIGTVTVTKVSGQKVQLGLEGQPELIFRRREVTEAIERGDREELAAV